MNDGLHVSDGWYFQRNASGDVVITKRASANEGERVEARVEIHASGWASVVAAVSRGGENSDTWQRALKFHDHGTHELDIVGNAPVSAMRSERLNSERSEKDKPHELGETGRVAQAIQRIRTMGVTSLSSIDRDRAIQDLLAAVRDEQTQEKHR